MASRSYRPPTPFERTPPARRASGLALALALNLLLLLALIGIGAYRPTHKGGSPLRTIVVNLTSDQSEQADASEDVRPQPDEALPPPPPQKSPPPPPPIVVPQAPKIPPPRPLEMIELSRADYQRADIAKMPKASVASGGASFGDSKEAGRGPNGEVLYAAEWAREPTDAELGGYLPASAPDGYGVIACKTLPQNRVDDCIELESGPRGSRLAGAVRQAAWQFRVRPPRKNGKPMIGAWVTIRIDYVHERGR